MLDECQHDQSLQSGQLEISLFGFSLQLGLQIFGSIKTEEGLLAEWAP